MSDSRSSTPPQYRLQHLMWLLTASAVLAALLAPWLRPLMPRFASLLAVWLRTASTREFLQFFLVGLFTLGAAAIAILLVHRANRNAERRAGEIVLRFEKVVLVDFLGGVLLLLFLLCFSGLLALLPMTPGLPLLTALMATSVTGLLLGLVVIELVSEFRHIEWRQRGFVTYATFVPWTHVTYCWIDRETIALKFRDVGGPLQVRIHSQDRARIAGFLREAGVSEEVRR